MGKSYPFTWTWIKKIYGLKITDYGKQKKKVDIKSLPPKLNVKVW